MGQAVRAVYEQGRLRLLDPVELTEGEEIQVTILTHEDRVRAALGDLLVEITDRTGDDLDEEALAREIEEGFRGQRPLSDTIIEERRQGP